MKRRRAKKNAKLRDYMNVGAGVAALALAGLLFAHGQGWISVHVPSAATATIADAASVPAPAPAKPAAQELDWDRLAALPWPKDGQRTYKSYDEAKRVFWRKLYPEGGVEIYCAVEFDAARRTAIKEKLSIEHAFPADSIAETFAGCTNRACDNPDSQRAAGDLNNLWPALQRVNSSRGKLKFADIPGENARRFVAFCPDFERSQGAAAVVEPADEVKGDLARSLVYMHFVYGLPLDVVAGDKEALLAWMKADPPDAEERRRNAVISELQSAGNPLIGAPGS